MIASRDFDEFFILFSLLSSISYPHSCCRKTNKLQQKQVVIRTFHTWRRENKDTVDTQGNEEKMVINVVVN